MGNRLGSLFGAVFVSVFAAVAIVIFWRRSDDPMALLVATMLVVWGPLNGLFVLTPDATRWISPTLEMTLNRVPTFVGYMAWMLFFYLFPSGRFVPRWTRWLGLCWILSVSLWNFTSFGPPTWPLYLFNVTVLVLWQLPDCPTLSLRASPTRPSANKPSGWCSGWQWPVALRPYSPWEQR